MAETIQSLMREISKLPNPVGSCSNLTLLEWTPNKQTYRATPVTFCLWCHEEWETGPHPANNCLWIRARKVGAVPRG